MCTRPLRVSLPDFCGASLNQLDVRDGVYRELVGAGDPQIVYAESLVAQDSVADDKPGALLGSQAFKQCHINAVTGKFLIRDSLAAQLGNLVTDCLGLAGAVSEVFDLALERRKVRQAHPSDWLSVCTSSVGDQQDTYGFCLTIPSEYHARPLGRTSTMKVWVRVTARSSKGRTNTLCASTKPCSGTTW